MKWTLGAVVLCLLVTIVALPWLASLPWWGRLLAGAGYVCVLGAGAVCDFLVDTFKSG